MKIRAGFEIGFGCVDPTPMLLMLHPHPSRLPDLLTPFKLRFEPAIDAREYQDSFGNTCTRILAPPKGVTIFSDFVVQDSGLPDRKAPSAEQVPVEHLPDDVLVYLLGSRYCDTDSLSDLAWSLFGNTPKGWARVEAICAYVHDRITFGYQHACATRSASQGHTEQIGVCRDFAHLAVTLCRCMNIPARYCTGYLGDIGVPVVPEPMDFSAWFDVYLGGEWYTFDARHNAARIGRILVARGRDATDVAISTSFGPTTLTKFHIVTDEMSA